MEILAYTTVTYFLCGQMDLFPGALRGMGRSGVPMILSIIGTVGLRIVWIFGIFPVHRSLKVLFISYPASWILTIIMQVTCFWFVRRKVHRRLKKYIGKIDHCTLDPGRQSHLEDLLQVLSLYGQF